MNVDGVGQNRIRPKVHGAETTSDQGRVRSGNQPEQASSDKLSLSEGAKKLQGALKAVQAAPDVREEKIAALRKQIADGTYNVPAETLARKILGGL